MQDDGSVVSFSNQIREQGRTGGGIMVKKPFTNQATKLRNLSTFQVTYQLQKNLQPTNFQKSSTYEFFCFNKLTNTKSQLKKSSPTNFSKFRKPTNSKSQKPANYQLFSLNQGGDRPPLDSHLSQPWTNFL